MYDVFISFKKSYKQGDKVKKTEDYYLAERINDELKDLGIKAYFSEENLKAEGTGDYKTSIVSAINSAQVFISVATKREFFESAWVKSEWDQYDNLRREGKKEKDSMFVLGGEDLLTNRPDELSGVQILLELDDLVAFVKNKFIKQFKNENILETSQSSYNYINEEEKRLIDQARIETAYDIKFFKKNLTDNSKTYNILDIGCSMGTVTKLVFGKLENDNISINLIGLDREEDCVKKFNISTPEYMTAYLVDLNEPNYLDKIVEIMNKNEIDKFDVVYSSLTMHHLVDHGEGVIKNVYKIMRDNGIIYIRSVDDCLHIAYPKCELMDEIIDKSAKCKGMSDRFHARKLYDYFLKAKFDNITYYNHYIDTIGKDLKQRSMIYDSAFAFRINYYYRNLEKAKNENNAREISEAQVAYDEMKRMLEEMKDSILNMAHFFGYFCPIVHAHKPSEFIDVEDDDI